MKEKVFYFYLVIRLIFTVKNYLKKYNGKNEIIFLGVICFYFNTYNGEDKVIL